MDQEAVKKFVLERIKGTEIFLVDINIKPGNRINIYIDKPEGINIEECVSMSREFNSLFDREEEDYDLQISSPGLDMPFKVKEQFDKYLGHEVKVVLENGEKHNAQLLENTGNELKLLIRKKVKTEKKKKKKVVTEEKIYKHSEIKAVTAVVSFK